MEAENKGYGVAGHQKGQIKDEKLLREGWGGKFGTQDGLISAGR